VGRRLAMCVVLALCACGGGAAMPEYVGRTEWTSTAELMASFGTPCATGVPPAGLVAEVCAVAIATVGPAAPRTCAGDVAAVNWWTYWGTSRKVDCGADATDPDFRRWHYLVEDDVPGWFLVEGR